MMDHPNIAKVLDAGMTLGTPASLSASDTAGAKSPTGMPALPVRAMPAGRPYFVMELVRGIRITDYCDQANLTTQSRLEHFIKVCQAIQHAHQKGIIHRDVYSLGVLLEQGMAGTPLVVTGRILDTHGRPLKGALLEVWQADYKGSYDNTGFLLRGKLYTDDEGR